MKTVVSMLTLTILSLIGSLVVISVLPNTVPIHLNFNMVVDNMGSKWIALIWAFLPLLCAIGILVEYLLRGKSYKNERALRITLVIVTIFLVYCNWVCLMFNNTGLNIGDRLNAPMTLIFGLPISILLIIMGNYLPAIKQNKTLGIKLSSTIKSEEVWNKTHQFSGYLWIAAGTFLLFSSLVCYFLKSNLAFLIIMLAVVLLVVLLIPTIYSYIIYNKIKGTLVKTAENKNKNLGKNITDVVECIEEEKEESTGIESLSEKKTKITAKNNEASDK